MYVGSEVLFVVVVRHHERARVDLAERLETYGHDDE